MFSAPSEFDRQDEGHSAYNPLTWKVITTYYIPIGQYPYKKYNGRTVLTGPFAGTQNNNKPYVINHFSKKNDYDITYKLKHQKRWQF